MKVAYVKLAMKIVLDPSEKVYSGLADRLGFLEQMMRWGWAVDFFSDVSEGYEKFGQFLPNSIPDDSYDFVFVENGPDNFVFTNSQKQPSILRAYDVIMGYPGNKIVYFQSDPELPMPLNPQAFTPIKEDDYYTSEKLLEGREFHVLCYARNSEGFRERFEGTRRYAYENLTEIHTVIPPREKWVMPIHRNPNPRMVYVGNERGGRRGKYLHDFSFPQMELYGKWKEKSLDGFRGEYKGVILQEDVWGLHNDSLCSPYIGDRSYYKYDCFMSRIIEVIQCRCLLAVDSRFQWASELFPDFVFSNKNELVGFLMRMKNSKYRMRSLEKQLTVLEELDVFNSFISVLNDLVVA